MGNRPLLPGWISLSQETYPYCLNIPLSREKEVVVKFVFLILLLFFPFGLSIAAEPSQEETLKPVVVIATRTETPQQEVTTSISVVTAGDIRAQQSETVLEALRNVPGLDIVQSGSRGTTTSVFIRGSDSDQVLVMVDGVEVNSTTLGSFNLAHLTTENIERIEILRGAGGTLYGSQAIGGVINIITKTGKGPTELGLSAEGGTGHTHRQTLSLRGGVERLGYSLTAARIETDGFHRFNDDYRNVSASGRLDYRLNEDSTLKGIFHLVKTEAGLFNSNSFIPLPDRNAREDLSEYIGKLQWEQRIMSGWDYRVSGSIFKEHDKFSDDPEPGSFDVRSRNRFRTQVSSADFQTNYRHGEWSTTTFGAEFKRRKASTSGGINRAIRNMGYYLQEQIRLFNGRLILIPGIRLDDHQTFGTEWSPAFSAAYLIGETGTKLKAGYAEGFKAPTLNELFFPSSTPGCPPFGDSSLEPEKSWELNAGFEQKFLAERIQIEGIFFHREVKDLIGFAPVAPGACPFTPLRAANLGRARFDGVEWIVGIKILSGLLAGANYTYLDWDTQNGRLARRPRHRGSVNLNYIYDGFHINLDVNIMGSRDDLDSVTSANITKAGHVKLDLAGSYALPLKIPLIQEIILFGKIENLLNKRYEEVDGFRVRPLNFLIGFRAVIGGD
jgi:vitamin B12 transporter